MAFLEVHDLGKSGAVEHISFSLERGQKLAISGETGSGKTTLLKMIAGMVQPDSGSVILNGIRVRGPMEQLIEGHKEIAFLSQHFELRNNYFVHEVLEYASKLPESDAQRLYALCRIDHLLSRRTHELSGGEKQRIALARLLSASPQLLLLDEPYSNLDIIHRKIMKAVVHDVSSTLNITCILVSHDSADMLSWADRIIILRKGHVLQAGTPEEIYFRPADRYAAGLFGEYNVITSGNNGNEYLIRPEQIRIVAEGQGIPARVERMRFFGSHYLADLLIDGKIFKARIYDRNIHPGDLVFVKWPVVGEQAMGNRQ